MTLREHPLLRRVLEAAREYRRRSLPEEDVQRVISGVMSAVESDVPKPLRDALFEAEARIDSARFTVDTPRRRDVITAILDELEATFDGSSG